MLAVTDPIGINKSSIDWVVPLNTIYTDLYREIKKQNNLCYSNPSLKGIMWAVSEGQSKSAELENYIYVYGMENIIEIFDEIENGNLDDVDYVEALVCSDGCVGGTFNIENPYKADNNIKHIMNNLDKENLSNEDLDKYEEFKQNDVFKLTINSAGADSDKKNKINIKEAIERMDKIKEIMNQLPGIDCGSCGAPTCHAMAEDIYDKKSDLYDCVVLRAKKNEN